MKYNEIHKHLLGNKVMHHNLEYYTVNSFSHKNIMDLFYLITYVIVTDMH